MTTPLETMIHSRPARPEDRARQLCLGILQVLRAARETASPLGAELQRHLAQQLEGGLHSFADCLREELPVWRDVLEQLDRLRGCQFLPSGGAVQALRDELEQARKQAGRMLKAIEDLGTGPAAASRGERLVSNGPAAATPLAVPESPPPPATRRCQQGNTLQRQKPYELAPSRREMSVPAPPGNGAASAAEKLAAKKATGEKRAHHLRVVCPECGAAGEVRWDRLGHLLTCRGCTRCYRVHPDGRLAEVVKTREGRWVERAKLKDLNPRLRALRRWLVGLVLVAGLFGLVVLVNRLLCGPSIPAESPPLPQELEARAELLARAWLSKDLFLMRRLTATTHDRAVYGWCIRHPPPALDLDKVTFEVQVLGQAQETASLRVRVKGLPGKAAGAVVDFPQQWVERGKTWQFLPSPR